MNNTVTGFLIACVILVIVYFVFRGSIHIGAIVNSVDSVLVVKHDTVRIKIHDVFIRYLPAKVDTVYVDSIKIVRASLDTVLVSEQYRDTLHVSYLEGLRIWENVSLRIQERSITRVDSSYRVHTTEIFYETSWTWAMIFAILGLILGSVL